MKKGMEYHGKCVRTWMCQVAFSYGKLYFLHDFNDQVSDDGTTRAKRMSVCTRHLDKNCINLTEYLQSMEYSSYQILKNLYNYYHLIYFHLDKFYFCTAAILNILFKLWIIFQYDVIHLEQFLLSQY